MTDRSRDVRVRILSEFYDEGTKAAERATRRLANLQMSAAQEDVAREAQRAAAVIEANRRQADAMAATGRSMVGVAAAIAIGLGLATKSAIDWESAWAGVSKTIDGSPEQMAALERELRGLALVLPATHEEIAGVAEAAGQLGVKREDVAAFTRTMIDMGETTNLSSEEAATSIAQLANIMGEGADKADEMGSAIVALGNDGASTERDIVSMALRIAGAGRTVGMSTDQVLAYSSALSSVGIEAEAGGTAISRVMLQIKNDIDSGSDTVARYAQIAGVSAEEFAASWGKDAAGALNQFISGLGRMQDEGGNTTAALDELGFADVRVADTLRRAALAGDLVTESLETSSGAWRENSALTEEARKRYETTGARLEIARNQINDAAIDIGGIFLPAVANATEGVGQLAVGFGALPPTAQEWVANLGAAAAGLTGIVGGAAIAIPKLHELRTTVDALHGGSSSAGKAIGGLTSILTGPWGLAIAGAVTAGAFWLQQQGEIKQNVDALSRSLDKQTGAITDNTRAQTVLRLQERGVLEAAQQLGLELDRVTDAALGNAGAMRYVAEAVEEQRAAEQAAATDSALFTDELVRRQNAADLLSRQMPGQRAELEASREEWQREAEALGEAADVTDTATSSTEMLNAELGVGEQAAANAATAIDDLAAALDDLNGPTLDARAAEREWHAQIREVTAALEENGTTLDATTEKGAANQAVLDGLARAGMARATALLDETGSVEQFNASLEGSRQALFENAKQFGLTDEAAWQYVDSVLAIPDTSTTRAILDTTAAERQLAWFKSTLANNNVVITADLRANNPFYANRANGGIDFFGNGGTRYEDHRAQILPAGTMRVWAEPETQGEAYIPLSPHKRPRSTEVLGDVANRFGLVVTRADQVGAQSSHMVAAEVDSSAVAAGVASALAGMHLELSIQGTGVREIARVEAVRVGKVSSGRPRR
ncbi:phage tail tape measure protein [Actinotalea sp. JY-7876]|uniref:phage tail tape measure protein n=1 Tax=Actinotalea sp. JY-7876 TaxID=2758442 RepID=UPI0015F5071E|nr:phage tail tape measure protein [Actinotalea sp. JY-7876]